MAFAHGIGNSALFRTRRIMLDFARSASKTAQLALDRIRIAADAPDRARLGLARVLSQALARWDDFDHAGALGLLEPFAARFARSYPSMLPTLRRLAGETHPQQDPARLFDLWLNAQRRASPGPLR